MTIPVHTPCNYSPGLFVWKPIGRSYWARFGNLSITVRALGSLAKGTLRWRVGDIFGNSHLGKESHVNIDNAILEAERIAAAEILPAMAALAPSKAER